MYGTVERDDTEITTYTATKKETGRVAVYITVTAADGVSGTGATSMRGQQRGLTKGRAADGRQWGRGSTRAKLVRRRPRSGTTGGADSTPALTRPASAPTGLLRGSIHKTEDTSASSIDYSAHEMTRFG
jgi:hypothetical protein